MSHKLFYVEKDGQPRHVVSAEETSEDTVEVRYVGLHPSVTGSARRGRSPRYKMVKTADLRPLEAEHLNKFDAEAVWAEAAQTDQSN